MSTSPSPFHCKVFPLSFSEGPFLHSSDPFLFQSNLSPPISFMWFILLLRSMQMNVVCFVGFICVFAVECWNHCSDNSCPGGCYSLLSQVLLACEPWAHKLVTLACDPQSYEHPYFTQTVFNTSQDFQKLLCLLILGRDFFVVVTRIKFSVHKHSVYIICLDLKLLLSSRSDSCTVLWMF